MEKVTTCLHEEMLKPGLELVWHKTPSRIDQISSTREFVKLTFLDGSGIEVVRTSVLLKLMNKKR